MFILLSNFKVTPVLLFLNMPTTWSCVKKSRKNSGFKQFRMVHLALIHSSSSGDFDKVNRLLIKLMNQFDFSAVFLFHISTSEQMQRENWRNFRKV